MKNITVFGKDYNILQPYSKFFVANIRELLNEVLKNSAKNCYEIQKEVVGYTDINVYSPEFNTIEDLVKYYKYVEDNFGEKKESPTQYLEAIEDYNAYIKTGVIYEVVMKNISVRTNIIGPHPAGHLLFVEGAKDLFKPSTEEAYLAQAQKKEETMQPKEEWFDSTYLKPDVTYLCDRGENLQYIVKNRTFTNKNDIKKGIANIFCHHSENINCYRLATPEECEMLEAAIKGVNPEPVKEKVRIEDSLYQVWEFEDFKNIYKFYDAPLVEKTPYIEYCLGLKTKTYYSYKKESSCPSSTDDWTKRLATQEEIDWLEKCHTEGQYLPLEESKTVKTPKTIENMKKLKGYFNGYIDGEHYYLAKINGDTVLNVLCIEGEELISDETTGDYKGVEWRAADKASIEWLNFCIKREVFVSLDVFLERKEAIAYTDLQRDICYNIYRYEDSDCIGLFKLEESWIDFEDESVTTAKAVSNLDEDEYFFYPANTEEADYYEICAAIGEYVPTDTINYWKSLPISPLNFAENKWYEVSETDGNILYYIFTNNAKYDLQFTNVVDPDADDSTTTSLDVADFEADEWIYKVVEDVDKISWLNYLKDDEEGISFENYKEKFLEQKVVQKTINNKSDMREWWQGLSPGGGDYVVCTRGGQTILEGYVYKTRHNKLGEGGFVTNNNGKKCGFSDGKTGDNYSNFRLADGYEVHAYNRNGGPCPVSMAVPPPKVAAVFQNPVAPQQAYKATPTPVVREVKKRRVSDFTFSTRRKSWDF